MKTIAKMTGMTEEQIKAFYIQKTNQARLFGFSEKEAKKMVQETFREVLLSK